MQTYRFRSKDGVELKLELADCEFRRRVKKGKIKIPGRMFGGATTYTLVGRSGPKTLGTMTACWPMESDNLGVDPSQVGARMAEDARIGVQADYNPDTGSPIFTSALHRKRYAEAHGYHVVTKKGSSSSRDPVRYSPRELEIRAMAGRSVRKCDD